MTPIKAQQNYRDILKDELALRSKRNAKYSLRSFARDLAMTAGNLSDILRGRHGLSVSKAEMIAQKLGYPREEQDHFCDLVRSEHHRIPVERQKATLRLEQQAKYHQLSLDTFSLVSEWQHFAIMELTRVKDFRSDPKWIAKKLGLTPKVVQQSLQNLSRLGITEEKDGVIRLTHTNNSTPTEVPSDAIKNFHRGILGKAISAVDSQKVEARDLSAMVVAIRSDDLPAAKESIKKFRRQFDETFGKHGDKDSVYCLGIQFFGLGTNQVTQGEL